MLKLMFITNNVEIAQVADAAGVDWVFVDLEIIGKDKRQGHLDTVISRHTLSDISPIRAVLKKSKLLVRINPINDDSKQEISTAIKNGGEIIMLPFFHTEQEVQKFIDYVGGQAQTCLLLETPEACRNIDKILEISGIDFIHIGLNDLHLGLHMKFLFEPLANGMVENLARKIRQKNIPFGFGGIAKIDSGTLPARKIIAEHYRLGSSMVILSRSFCMPAEDENLSDLKKLFETGIKQIRDFETSLENYSYAYFEQNQKEIQRKVAEIISKA